MNETETILRKQENREKGAGRGTGAAEGLAVGQAEVKRARETLSRYQAAKSRLIWKRICLKPLRFWLQMKRNSLPELV